MTVVSSKEFATHQKKYYDLAINEQVVIRRGKHKFHLTCSNIDNADVKERVYYEPDEDFYNSITMDELLERVLDDVRVFYPDKNK